MWRASGRITVRAAGLTLEAGGAQPPPSCPASGATVAENDGQCGLSLASRWGRFLSPATVPAAPSNPRGFFVVAMVPESRDSMHQQNAQQLFSALQSASEADSGMEHEKHKSSQVKAIRDIARQSIVTIRRLTIAQKTWKGVD